MGDLAAFVLARLAEREEAARACDAQVWAVETEQRTALGKTSDSTWLSGPGFNVARSVDPAAMDPADADHIARHDPARVLAEVAAKRAIVERYMHLAEHGDSGDARWVLPLLAQPNADHPDYDPAWNVQA